MADAKFSALPAVDDHGPLDGFVIVRDGDAAARVLGGPRWMRATLVTFADGDQSDPVARVHVYDSAAPDPDGGYYLYGGDARMDGAAVSMSGESDLIGVGGGIFISGGPVQSVGGAETVYGGGSAFIGGGPASYQGVNSSGAGLNLGGGGREQGGHASLVAGETSAPAGSGGNALLVAGQANNGGQGGHVSIVSGNGGNDAGRIEIRSGNASAGSGGDITVEVGTGAGGAGEIALGQGDQGKAGVRLSVTNDGSKDPLVGFFDHAPAAKPTGVTVDAAGIHAALVSLGLISA